MAKAAAVIEPVFSTAPDVEYRRYLVRVDKGFAARTEKQPLFTTNAEGLFAAYLAALPAAERQFHTCHACRHFIERYGGLVTIDEAGETASAIWQDADWHDAGSELYKASTAAMAKIVERAQVTGVFLSSEKVWGHPLTGKWQHYHLASVPQYKGTILNAVQAMAEKREDFKNVMAALGDYPLAVIEQALRVLHSDALYRSEKVLGAAEWLRELWLARSMLRGEISRNVCWRMIAEAPAGFCHPRSSMIGTLLDDIASGKDFEEVSQRFAAKMHPLAYQRPQAAPKAGAIAQAEKIVEQLGAAGSLARRFARPDEVKALWSHVDPAPSPSSAGVFAHLKGKTAPSYSLDLPASTITWEKFNRTILPFAANIDFYVRAQDNYSVLLTAVNPEAPPILQWDLEEERNPVSWYLWNGGSPATQFSLTPRQYQKVVAIALKPSMWGSRPVPHQGEGVMFILDGARESRTVGAGVALFPEILKSEFHGIRSVIEAYSHGATLEDSGAPHAIGPMFFKHDKKWNARVRVTTNGQSAVFDIDRWD